MPLRWNLENHLKFSNPINETTVTECIIIEATTTTDDDDGRMSDYDDDYDDDMRSGVCLYSLIIK